MSIVQGKDTDAGLFDLPGEYVNAEKSIKMIDRKMFPAINTRAGDSVTMTYKGRYEPQERAKQLGKEDIYYQRTFDIKRPMAVDTAVVLEIKDAFGLEVGCGILIGESAKT